MPPTAGTRAPMGHALCAPGFLLSPSEPSEPKVTWLVNTSAQHCPPGSHLLEREKAEGGGVGRGAGTGSCDGGDLAYADLAEVRLRGQAPG